jgi:hypothetical protein
MTWTPNPTASVMLDPTAKVSGVFEITWQGNGNIYVGTHGAHVNDDNAAIDFRGESWLVSLHFVRQSDGSYATSPNGRPHVTRRQNWSDASPAASSAIVAAIAEAVEAVTTDADIRAGERADAGQAIHSAERTAGELAEELAEQRAIIRKAKRRIAANS